MLHSDRHFELDQFPAVKPSLKLGKACFGRSGSSSSRNYHPHTATAPSLWRKQNRFRQKLSSTFAVMAAASYRMDQDVNSF